MLPDSIRICGIDFNIVELGCLSKAKKIKAMGLGAEAVGYCDVDKHNLEIKHGIPQSFKVLTFIHEALHAINIIKSLELGELEITRIGEVIYKLLVDSRYDDRKLGNRDIVKAIIDVEHYLNREDATHCVFDERTVLELKKVIRTAIDSLITNKIPLR